LSESARTSNPDKQSSSSPRSKHAIVARAIADSAYRAGARRVDVSYGDLHVRRAAVEHGPEDELGRGPEHIIEWMGRWADDRPAVISLTAIRIRI